MTKLKCGQSIFTKIYQNNYKKCKFIGADYSYLRRNKCAHRVSDNFMKFPGVTITLEHPVYIYMLDGGCETQILDYKAVV